MPEGPEPVAYDQSQDNRYVIEKQQQQPATRRVSFMPPTDHEGFRRFVIIFKLLNLFFSGRNVSSSHVS